MLSETVDHNFTNVIKLADFVECHPDLFTDGQMNWLIRNREQNGLSEAGAVLQVGRKIYINKPKFLEWFMGQRG